MYRAQIVWFVALLVVVTPTRAAAYRTFADDPAVMRAVRWEPGSTIGWEVYEPSFGDGLDARVVAGATAAASALWHSTACNSPDGTVQVATDSEPRGPGDGRNTVLLITDDWSGRGFPVGRGAFTDVRIVLGDARAQIVEADIYLNAVDYEFGTDGRDPNLLDVHAVLDHEMGHAYGLLHPCELDATDGAPLCSAEPELTESLLFPTHGLGAGELSNDDHDGLCALYSAVGGCAESCAMGFECRDGRCQPDCSDGGCGDCQSDADCDTGRCGLAAPALGRCIAAGDTGASCSRAEDCSSGLCLESDRHPSYCTVECSSDANCAGMQVCREASGRRVCAPVPPVQSCAVGLAPASRHPGGVVVTALAMLVALYRRRCR